MSNDVLYFLAIERTGTRTLHNILLDYFGDTAFRANNHSVFDYMALPEAERQQHRYIASHWCYQFETVVGFKPQYITLLRNPVDRVISHYRLLKQHQLTADDTLAQFLNNPLNRHVVSDFQTNSLYFSQWPDEAKLRTYTASAAHHPWFSGIEGVSGQVRLDIAKERLAQMAVVGITEYFDATVRWLCRTLDLPPVQQYENYNITAARQRVDDATYWQIAAHNPLDFELWRYGLELFAGQLAKGVTIS